jgi:hypothetical protein
MRKILSTIFVVMFATVWIYSQATYSDFAPQSNATGGVSTDFFHEGTQSYKLQGNGADQPGLQITINNIPDWTTITKVSLWIYTTAGWSSGNISINATIPGWTSSGFTAVTNTWTNFVWDFSGTPFDISDTWGQLWVQDWNAEGDLYFDEITFYNAAGDVVYIIDATDVSAPPTSISLVPVVNTAISGKSIPIAVSVEPSGSGTACNFTSSDEAVATVDAFGTVTTLSAGSVTITATSKLDALVSSTADISVTEPDVANSLVYANFENGLGNYDGAWASWINNASGPVPTVEIVDNPSTTSNATAKALKVTNFRQWGAIVFKAFDANKINVVKFKVYSETAVTDLSFEIELGGGTSSRITTPVTALAAATWTDYTYEIKSPQSADHQVSMKLAASGSATAAYTLYFDYVELLAGNTLIPVSSLVADGVGGVTEITVDGGTLQMEAKDYLPVDASNKTVNWIITGTNNPVIATITPEGLLSAVRNGTATARAIADGDGVFADKVVTITNQILPLSDLSAVAKKIDAPHDTSATDFSVNFDMTYDADSIYMVFDVKDDSIVNEGANNYMIDNIEIYFDMANLKTPLWPRGAGWPNSSFVKGNDYQLRLVPDKNWADNNTLGGVNQVYTRVEGGYQFIVNIPIDSLSAGFETTLGKQIGFDILASDNDMTPDYRDQLSWNSNSDMIWNDPSYWGTVAFAENGTFNVIEDRENPTAPANVKAVVANKNVNLTWDASSDNVVVQSYIIKNGVKADTILAIKTGNKFTVSNLVIGKYTFSVTAVDVSGNKSEVTLSNEVEVVNWTEFTVAKKIDAPNISSAADFSVKLKMRWDADSIYTIFDVKDDIIVDSGANNYMIDNIEFYFDMANLKTPLWPRGSGWPNSSLVKGNDYQFRLVPDSGWSANNTLKGVNQVYTAVTGGYQFKVNIPIDSLSQTFVPAVGSKIGFDVLASDNDMAPDYRDQLSWNSNSDMIWNDPSYWGTLEFAADGVLTTITDTEAPTAVLNIVAAATGKNVKLTWDASTDNIVVQKYIIIGPNVDTILAKETANTFTVKDLVAGNYTFSVIAVDVNGLNSPLNTSNEVTVLNVGVNQTKTSMFIGPNPVADVLNIQSPEIINSVSIYNMSGKQMKILNVNATSSVVDFTGYKNGIYFVKVQTSKDVKIQKIVKE